MVGALQSRLEILRPTYIASSVEVLPGSPEIFEGVDLVMYDVDGTLADYHQGPDIGVASTLRQVADLGLSQCIGSNAYGHRVEELREIFGDPFDMPVFTPASVTPAGMRVKDYRKPNEEMILHAARLHGVDRSAVLMVGDQLFKDVLSARRAGSKSLLVPRRGHGDHIGVRILQRPSEAIVRLALGINFPREGVVKLDS